MLPSRYISTVYLPTTTNCYFDTGVFPSNTLDIDAIFRTPDTGNTYLFGARNTNSNTSAGQTNLLVASTSYIGYASARISVSNMSGKTFFAKRGNGFETTSGTFVNDKTGATTEFTGTRSMYILAMNNAGTPNYGSSPVGGVYSFAILQNGTKIKDYFPVYDTQSQTFGLYAFVNNVFLANRQNHMVFSNLWEKLKDIIEKLFIVFFKIIITIIRIIIIPIMIVRIIISQIKVIIFIIVL